MQHDEESNDWKKLQSLLMQLRKCINHPYKFPGAEPDFDGNTGEDIVAASGKMMVSVLDIHDASQQLGPPLDSH